MFDDLETATKEIQTADDQDRPSSQAYRWAHIPAFLTFLLLIVSLHRYRWGWQIAVGVGYTVYVFWFAFGFVLKDADDLFGDSRVPKYAAKLLIPHALIVAAIIAGVTEWFHLKPMLPDWMTHEGRKESLWDLFGWLLLGGAGIWQGFWMGKKLKRRFSNSED